VTGVIKLTRPITWEAVARRGHLLRAPPARRLVRPPNARYYMISISDRRRSNWPVSRLDSPTRPCRRRCYSCSRVVAAKLRGLWVYCLPCYTATI